MTTYSVSLKILVYLFYITVGCVYLFNFSSNVSGGRRGSMWPRGYTSCWGMCTIKTRVMPSIPTKSDTCTSTSSLLGNVFTAKSCKGEKRVPDAFKLGPTSEGRQPRHKTLVLQNSWGLGVRLTTPPYKTIIVTKASKM
jgi:hypothetical protein